MRKIAPHFLILSLTFLFFDCLAQQNHKFSKPDLSLEGTILLVSFDILNSKPSDKFIISIEVTDSTGNKIKPKALTGDFGDFVYGGDGKLIYWDLKADGISLDQALQMEIVGERRIEAETADSENQITRFGALARSLAFPGWGLSVLNPGKPHWIRGLASYGAVAGSLVLNQSSHKNYEKYLDSSDETDRTTFYNKSVNQEQWSVVMAYTAAGIWVADIIWTFVGTRNPPKQYGSIHQKGISLGSTYEPVSDTPLLVIKYTF